VCFHTKQAKKLSNNTVLVNKSTYQTGYYYHRDEEWHISNCLDCPGEVLMPNFINKKGQEDRGRKLEEEAIKANPKCIAQQAPKENAAKEVTEMLYANPLAAPYTIGRPKVPKSNLRPVHRAVLEDNKVCQNRRYHYIQTPVALNVFYKARTEGFCMLRPVTAKPRAAPFIWGTYCGH